MIHNYGNHSTSSFRVVPAMSKESSGRGLRSFVHSFVGSFIEEKTEWILKGEERNKERCRGTKV